ncbi:hypothetical protein GE061_010902 [Apolygus lucorum]|uniref:tRNA (guanine(10)-N(2))-methyltransferase TRMT11 n=1 Tax=Apolygus lucorum TaxID=248454 RepID=A0A8S9XYL1_APOLU|nr:hypothetical protein GE061_010902 [Apolygus lucorum]
MNESSALRKYILWFAYEHLDFRFQEIESIASLLNVDLTWIHKSAENPFWLVEVRSEEDVVKLTSRSVTLRYAIELWSSSSQREDFHDQLKSLPTAFTAPYFDENVSYKVKVEVFGSSQTQAEKVQRIESFSYLPLKGPVKLNNPDVSFQYIEYYGHDTVNIPCEPHHFYFGRIVSEGQRDLIKKLSLKSRKFIGNTSMDPQLSLIMANQALVKNGSLVYDPFVGSGSLLIGAAQFGGLVMGADLDYLMVHGMSRPTRKQARHKPRHEENILANMKQYGFAHRYVDVVVADFALPLWHDSFKLDAIITDPPYGVREAVERLGTAKEDKNISDRHLPTHIPCKIHYSMAQLLHDLLSFAAKHLRMGARLVTWIPVIRLEYDESQLPRHDCLRLIANSEQILSTNGSRRLLTYGKIGEPKEETRTIVEEEETYRQKYSRYIEENRKHKMEDDHKGKKFKNSTE